MISNNDSRFLVSALAISDALNDLNEVKAWLKAQNERVGVNIKEISFNNLKQWELDDNALRHSSGKFFSIDGINVKTNWGSVKEWEQPIINQPEIGYLGFITKEFNGILHFLMQAKVEPGNVNYVQLSPTLQATKSNYTKTHQGKAPDYLAYFQNASRENIILDQLQSEQGARFLKKRNRNIIIKTEEAIEVLDNFTWLTLGQIKQLMHVDNLINMDTRTVISGLSYGEFSFEDIDLLYLLNPNKFKNALSIKFLKSSAAYNQGLHSINQIIKFLTYHKSKYELSVTQVPLKSLKNWVVDDHTIHHVEHKYFEIIAASVEISNREVATWTQPMVKPAQEGLCAFICKEISGIMHFLVQAKLECGNFDIIELAPTVQCLTGNYKTSISLSTLPYLEYVTSVAKENIIFDTLQSEEGGRFYREQNRNMIIIADEDFSETLPENYIWMTLNQLQSFIKYNNYLNIQARSLIAAISFTTL